MICFIFQALPYISAAGFGAELLGVFSNGMVQSFIDARTLEPSGDVLFLSCKLKSKFFVHLQLTLDILMLSTGAIVIFVHANNIQLLELEATELRQA